MVQTLFEDSAPTLSFLYSQSDTSTRVTLTLPIVEFYSNPMHGRRPSSPPFLTVCSRRENTRGSALSRRSPQNDLGSPSTFSAMNDKIKLVEIGAIWYSLEVPCAGKCRQFGDVTGARIDAVSEVRHPLGLPRFSS